MSLMSNMSTEVSTWGNTGLDSTNQTTAVPRKQYITTEQLIIIVEVFNAAGFFITGGGCLSSICNIIVFRTMGLKDSVTFCLFTQSTIDCLCLMGGFIVQIFSAVVTLMKYLHVYMNPIVNNGPVLQVLGSYGYALYDMSIYTTVYITIQRCFCVALPLHFSSFFTKRRSSVVICVIVVYAIACKIPSCLAHTLKTAGIPGTNLSIVVLHIDRRFYQIARPISSFNMTVLSTICYALVFISFLILATSLRKSAKFRQASSASAGAKTQTDAKPDKSSQVVRTVFFMAVLFLITNLPRTISTLLDQFYPPFRITGPYLPFAFLLNYFAFNTEYANSGLNFFVYYRCNTKFRNTFKARFRIMMKDTNEVEAESSK